MKMAFIEISGPDASTYLQGQVSCDVRKASQQAILGCLCNIQGRIEILFRLFKSGDNLILVFPDELTEKCLARLRKYAIFSKVEIKEVTSAFKVNFQKTTEEAQACFKVSDSLYEIYLTTKEIRKSELSEQQWHLGKIKAGLPEIYASSSEKFLPHHLNLDKLGALDFEKGCYTGQEIIARMHYRGKLKKHMQLVEIASNKSLTPANEYNDADNIKGEIVDSAPDGDAQWALIIK